MAALYLAVPNPRPDFTRFNCNDSECYLSLAWNLAHGRGYTRSMVADVYIPHTTWPPGTPALMVPAVLVSGTTINWYAVKWTMCLVSLAGVVFAWCYARRVTGEPRLAGAAALLVGLSPLYWDFGHQAMAEVPLTAWVLGGIYLVDRVWAGRKVRVPEALAAGFVCGLGMMFKGHAGGLVFAPLAYLVGERRSSLAPRPALALWLVFAAGFAVPQLCWMARNHAVPAAGFEGINRFRSILAVDPNDASSRLVSGREFVGRLAENIRFHAVYRVAEEMIPGLWAEGTWGWRGSGVVATLLTLVLLALAVPRRPGAFAPCLVAAPMVALNLAYGFGGSARFWLPVTSLLTLAVLINLGPVLVRLFRVPALAVALVFLLFLNLSLYVAEHEAHPYNRTASSWRELAELFQAVAREEGLRPAGVLTKNPDAFQLMTGLRAPWGWDDLLYDYAVLDASKGDLPPGSEVVVSRPPWVFVALPEPMTRAQVTQAGARVK
jgi:hypothetical protein